MNIFTLAIKNFLLPRNIPTVLTPFRPRLKLRFIGYRLFANLYLLHCKIRIIMNYNKYYNKYYNSFYIYYQLNNSIYYYSCTFNYHISFKKVYEYIIQLKLVIL